MENRVASIHHSLMAFWAAPWKGPGRHWRLNQHFLLVVFWWLVCLCERLNGRAQDQDALAYSADGVSRRARLSVQGCER